MLLNLLIKINRFMFELFAWFWLLLGIPLGGVAAYLISKLGEYLPDFIAKYLTGASIFAAILFAIIWFFVVAIIQLVVFPPMRILFTMDSRLENITKKYGDHTLDFSEQDGMSSEHKKGLAIGSGVVALILVITGVVCALVGGSGVALPVRCVKGDSDVMTDSRDGKTYKTVKIGSQTWMAENLNYNTSNSECFEGLEENCEKFGRKYTKREAIEACPAGWHLPSSKEFQAAAKSFGGEPDGDNKSNWFGMNPFIEAFLGDLEMPKGYCNIANGLDPNVDDSYACYWSNSKSDDDLYNQYFGAKILTEIYADYYKDYKFSVRCVKN